MQAVFAKDMDKVLKGFAENARFRVYWGNTGEFNEYLGHAGIREWYENEFYAKLGDMSDLKAPIRGREENMCFFAWEAPQRGFTRCFDTVVFEDTAEGWKIKYQNVTGSRDSTVGAVARSCPPATASEAFEEHMQAVFAKDMDKVLKGFAENARFRVYWGNTGEFNEYLGHAGIREWYENEFYAKLGDMSDLKAPIRGREENMCFFAWEAPQRGFTRCFDTVVFEDTAEGWKIKYQNVTGSKS